METPRDAAGPRAVRLAEASSLYLREASGQPIDWHPWGNEPFEIAQRTGRPVLLDIGASWCHWCHVMDEGTYTDPEVGRLLREHFITVKVDRDEHPEVDRRYQRQVNAVSGEGGWPLTAFLTPAGDVFYGGTYYPPSDGHGRPGFRRVLKEIARLWSEEPERVRDNAATVRDALARMGRGPQGPAHELGSFVDQVVRELSSSFDPVHGGFGTAPKFPHPSAVALLLWDEHRSGAASSREAALETLLGMANGGVYDQLGGGFHRYSVDDGWHVPHFEKMGIDNAELLTVYVDGYRRFGDPRLEEVVRGIVAWTGGVLGDPDGGWGTSQDADNAPGDDGSYFTWSRQELKDALGPDASRFVARVFGVGTDATMPHDPERNVLFRLLPVSEAAEGLRLDRDPATAFRDACAQLLEVRTRRPAPRVDRALYASINGRYVGALTSAAMALDEPAWLDEARRAADRWIGRAFDPGRGVAHRLDARGAHGYGLLDDQVALAAGLLELAVADARPAYLERATDLLTLVDREFRGEDGLLRDVAPGLYDGPEVGGATEAAYPLEDNPHLSSNAAAALAFVRLGSLRHDDRWREKARALVRAAAGRIGGAGLFASGAALAAGLLGTSPVQVVVEGDGPGARALLAAARRSWHPNVAVFHGHPPPPFSLASEVAPAPASSSGARAIVCFDRSCAPPVTDPGELSRLVRLGRST
ncbi:MAG TPA: thioredoxin domain-containing protein [Thermoplasmata archaeon]|nr:thioredoxin domain-containing protein [Thermoplasmata archaeon]